MAFSINALLSAIQFAVIEAQEVAEEQHMRQMAEYFTEDGTPVTVPLRLPNPGYNGSNAQYVKVDIPKITLVPQKSITIAELEVEMEVPIGDLDLDEEDLPIEVRPLMSDARWDATLAARRLSRRPEKRHLIGGRKKKLQVSGKGSFLGSKQNTARIKVRFEGTEPPEVVARIEQSLVKGVET